MSCVVMCRCVNVFGCVWVSMNVRGCALVCVQNCSWVCAGMLGCVSGVRVCSGVCMGVRRCAGICSSVCVCEYSLVCSGASFFIKFQN